MNINEPRFVVGFALIVLAATLIWAHSCRASQEPSPPQPAPTTVEQTQPEETTAPEQTLPDTGGVGP